MRKGSLLISIFAAVFLAILVGCLNPALAVKMKILGDLFLNALKMMVLPLIVSSLIVGITSLGDPRRLGSIGVKTIVYYMITTALAVLVGMVLVLLLQPGTGFGQFAGELPEHIRQKGQFSFMDVLTGLIHPNLVQAASEFDILPLIIASILFGISISLLGEKGRVLVNFFEALNEAIMKIVGWIIVLTPVGVFGLIAYRLGASGGGPAFWDLFTRLAKFCITVLLGLAIHGFVILPMILAIFARRNPMMYFLNLAQALVTALATSSSSATLPVTMECVTQEGKVSRETAGVVLPLGATINMDGTALYEAVAAIFIAQCYNISLGLGSQLVIFLTATLAAIGAAGIPSAGLVTMILVLQSVGLPTEGIGLLLAIDWFLDRCRTTVNVWGDAVGAATVDALEQGKRQRA